MAEHRVDLLAPVVGAQVDELRRRVFFVDDSIVDFRLEPSPQRVTTVVLTVAGAGDPQLLARRLNMMVDNDVRGQLPIPAKILWRSPHRGGVDDDAFFRLSANGTAWEVGVGRVGLGQPAIALLEALDALVRDYVVERFGATEYRYPTLLPVDALRRSGYLASFPQYLMFVTRPRGDVDSYRELARAAADGGDVGARVLAGSAGVDLVLPPTMCYHTFHQLADAPLGRPQAVVTARGASFRHESRYHRTPERLADFTIREVVFLGTEDFVRAARDQLRDAVLGMVEELGLRGRCEVASDPFFGTPDGAARISSQRLLELKHELHLDVAPDRSIAVASFNLHERHFGTTFGITGPDGRPVATACAGFGLERLTYAVLCQLGDDPASWPDLLRARMAGPPPPRREGTDQR